MKRPFYRLAEGSDKATALSPADGPATATGLLLIPTEQVVLIEATLPRPLSRKLARQAAPNIIEELLSEDPADLHFAYPDKAPPGIRMPMAVCSPALLRDHLDRCDTVPEHAIPDVLALPLHDNAWSLYLEPGRCLIRTGSFSGYAVDPANLDLMLESIADQTSAPDALHLYGDEGFLPNLSPRFSIQVHTKNLAEICHYQADQCIDLLQGAFRPRHGLGERIHPWLLPLGIMLLWWLVSVTNSLLEIDTVQKDNQAAEERLQESFTRLMPRGTRMVNPTVQARRYLAEASRANTSSTIFALLDPLARALATTGKFQLERLDYREQRLEVQLNSKDIQQLDNLAKRLNTTTVRAQLKQLNLNQGVATANLVLTRSSTEESPPPR
jgi:general secretion pathway protein L